MEIFSDRTHIDPVVFDAQKYHGFLMRNAKLGHFSSEDWKTLLKAIQFAYETHASEWRKVSQSPYIVHPIEIVDSYIEQMGMHSNVVSICTLLLHDTIETNPDAWRYIHEHFSREIFFRVLKLSPLKRETRMEIREYIRDSDEQEFREAIIVLLSHDDAQAVGNYLLHHSQTEVASFRSLFEQYPRYLGKYCPSLSREKVESERDGLWHYMFFDKKDALHKWLDTMHNLGDINNMKLEKKKEYMARRVPKLNTLQMVLNRYGMIDEISALKLRWQEASGETNQHGIFTIGNRVVRVLELPQGDFAQTIISE